MTIQTLTLSQIQASAFNPRKSFNDTGIAELAQSIKTDGLGQLEHRCHGGLEALDTTVGNCHTVAKSGGAQPFTGKQAVGDQRTAQAMQVLKQQACFFKSTFFAGDVDLRKNLRSGEDGRESVHGVRRIMHTKNRP